MNGTDRCNTGIDLTFIALFIEGDSKEFDHLYSLFMQMIRNDSTQVHTYQPVLLPRKASYFEGGTQQLSNAAQQNTFRQRVKANAVSN